MIGYTLAKQVASAFKKYGFACLDYDFLIGKAKLLRPSRNKNECVLRHEYIARLLFDALMVFSETEPAGLQEAAIWVANKIVRNIEVDEVFTVYL